MTPCALHWQSMTDALKANGATVSSIDTVSKNGDRLDEKEFLQKGNFDPATYAFAVIARGAENTGKQVIDCPACAMGDLADQRIRKSSLAAAATEKSL